MVAVDGTLLPVPDAPASLAVFTRQRLGNGISGYPQLRLAVLVACGTRSVIGAEITVRTAAGTRTGHYRLLTTLTDPATHPAAELVRVRGVFVAQSS